MEYKISVIVPCYSVGSKFLSEALKSINQQTYENWEIILVDDCSPHQEWKMDIVANLINDHKLKLINNQKNLGLSISRNIGFDKSNGDIIIFLDADDKYSNNNFFKYLNKKFNEFEDLDVLHFSFQNFLKNEKKKINKIENTYFKKLKIEDFALKPKFTAVSACVKAYKKLFLIKHDIRFLEKNTFYEDWVFWFQVLCKEPNLFWTNENFYLYRKRQNSIVWNAKKNKYWDIDCLKIAKNDIEEYINKLNRGGGWS